VSDAATKPLPPGWTWTTLAAIADIKGGITKGQQRRSRDGLRSVPYLRVANVQRGFLDLEDVKLIEAAEEEIRELRLIPGDVLFNEGGDRDKLGRGWIWRGELPECIHQNHVFRARLYSLDIEPKYISFYGNSLGQQYFLAEGKQTTNLASINLTKLGALPVLLAPAREQYRIVAEIDRHFTRLDAAVASLKRAQANLKRYRAAVLKAACEGRLVPTEAELARVEGREYEPANDLLDRVLINGHTRTGDPHGETTADGQHLPSTPKGWLWLRLDQALVSLRNGIGIKPDAESGTPMLRISAVRPRSVNMDDIRFLTGKPEQWSTYTLQEGDLLFTRYNGNPALVGVCGMVRHAPRITVHPDKLIRAQVNTDLVLPGFLEIVLNVGASRDFLARRVRTTAGQAGVSGADLRHMPFPLPPLAEQQRIIAEVDRRLSVVDELEAAVAANVKRADRLRQTILKRAFEGKLVPQDPDDEPASVLLERIRAERNGTQPPPRRRAPTRAPRPNRRSIPGMQPLFELPS
jgi:type I restriction enzyme, S subunit